MTSPVSVRAEGQTVMSAFGLKGANLGPNSFSGVGRGFLTADQLSPGSGVGRDDRRQFTHDVFTSRWRRRVSLTVTDPGLLCPVFFRIS